MWSLLVIAAFALSPIQHAYDVIAHADDDDWQAHWDPLIVSLDAADPDAGPTDLNHEAVVALALATTALTDAGRDPALIDDDVRAQLVRRNPLTRAYDAESIERGAQYRQALARAVTALSRDPRSLCIELRAVRAWYELGQHDRALEYVRRLPALYTHPYDVAVTEHLVGQLLLKEGQWDEALAVLHRARVTYDPDARRVQRAPTLDRAILWADLAVTYDRLDDDRSARRARRQVKKAIKRGPSDSLWFDDQQRLTVVPDQPFQGTCWDGDAYWSTLDAASSP